MQVDYKPQVYILFVWPGLLEAWLVLTSVKYHGNLYILIPLNQRLALTRLRATGPWSIVFFNTVLHSFTVHKEKKGKICLGGTSS